MSPSAVGHRYMRDSVSSIDRFKNLCLTRCKASLPVRAGHRGDFRSREKSNLVVFRALPQSLPNLKGNKKLCFVTFIIVRLAKVLFDLIGV